MPPAEPDSLPPLPTPPTSRPSGDHPGDLPAEEVREALHRAADYVLDYLEGVGRYPVMPAISPGEVRASLSARPPECGERLSRLLDDYKALIEPNTTHWNHPGFMAYFAVTGSGGGIVGELLSAALNVNAMLWRTGPAPTELEELACDWVRQMIGLPEGFRGHINDTASISSLVSLAAARERYLDLDIRRRGMAGRSDLPRLTMYCSDQAHSSIDKAAVTLGIGLENLRRIPSNERFELDVGALESRLAEDKAAGCKPIALVATLGTTSTTSVDPVLRMAEIAEREGLWLHVDGAYAGSAAVCPEFRERFEGWERADSVVLNPHKWLFVPVDCSVLLVRDPDLLRRAFSIVPDYLTTTESDVTNLMDYGVQLGRRFRALKLWMVIRSFGVSGIRERIRFHCSLARELEDWVSEERGFELVAPVPFSTVCFRAVPEMSVDDQDAFNAALLERVNRTGPVLVSHTKLRGRYVMRLAIGNLRTTREHVKYAWDLIRRRHAELLQEAS